MRPLLFAAACLIAADAAAAGTPAPPPTCSPTELRPLAFWLSGREADAAQDSRGRRRLKAVLDGCAISEHWSSSGGQPADRDDTAGRRSTAKAAHRRITTARTATLPR